MKKKIKLALTSLAFLPGMALALEVINGNSLNKNTGNIQNIIGKVINFIIGTASSIAVIVLVIGGVMYMLSGGNKETAEKAKKFLFAAIIGLVIIIFAYTIVNIIVKNVPNWIG